MIIKKINDIFSEEEISSFNNMFNQISNDATDELFDFSISEELGRVNFTVHNMQEDLLKKPIDIAKSSLDFDCVLASVTFVEYNSKYGNPNLPPHFDGDTTDLIINYQLSSNAEWDIGVGFDLFKIEDNSALVFNPNESAHWRTIKTFKEGDFVRMIFFRFTNSNRLTDYSHLSDEWPMDDFFIDLRNFRDSFTQWS